MGAAAADEQEPEGFLLMIPLVGTSPTASNTSNEATPPPPTAASNNPAAEPPAPSNKQLNSFTVICKQSDRTAENFAMKGFHCSTEQAENGLSRARTCICNYKKKTFAV